MKIMKPRLSSQMRKKNPTLSGVGIKQLKISTKKI
jgi:hypothetical protein